MKTKKIGIELIHFTEADVWYQYTHQCIFEDILTAHTFVLSRLKIEKEETEIIFEQLDMKEYLRYGEIIYYGCRVVRKVKSTKIDWLKNFKKLHKGNYTDPD